MLLHAYTDSINYMRTIKNYPLWYLNLPVKPGFIYAAGEKTFNVRETAFVLAEAAVDL